MDAGEGPRRCKVPHDLAGHVDTSVGGVVEALDQPLRNGELGRLGGQLVRTRGLAMTPAPT